MYKKPLQNLAQSKHSSQVIKLHLPLKKMNDKRQAQNQNLEESLNKKLQKIIVQKLNDVQNENKKLLTLATKINNASLIFNNDDSLHEVIYSIQEQMKSAFNDLIQSIQEFYIDIDNKIKEIGSYLVSLSGMETLQTSSRLQEDLNIPSNPFQANKNPHQKSSQQTHDNETLRSINLKIEMLQKDLDETKSNQKKLMTIIDKLVSKYQLNHQTTIVKQDTFLKHKIQNIAGKLQPNSNQSHFIKDQKYSQFTGQNSGKFVEANTFSKNHTISPQYQLNHNGVTIKGNFSNSNSNVGKRTENTQRNVPFAQNPNDYSICHELNKIQDLHSEKHSCVQKQRQNFKNVNHQQPIIKNTAIENGADVLGSSTISVQSYAYSNSISQYQQEQCFIKKLYSKQTPTLNKVSLKGNTHNNTFFQFNKTKQSPIDQNNKVHREAYLLAQLKR